MISEKNLILIERYLLEVMEPAEMAEFEMQLKSDPQLDEELENYRRAISTLRLSKSQILREELGQLEKKIKKKERLKKNLTIGFITILSCIGLFLLYFWINRPFNKNSDPDLKPEIPMDSISGEKIQDTIIALKDSVETTPKDTGFKTPFVSKNEISRKKPTSGKDPQTIYLTYFTPHHDETMELNIRGNGASEYYNRFLKYYIQKEYLSAIAVYDSMSLKLQENDNCRFIKANAFMALGDMQSSRPLLERIIKNEKSRYVSDAKWYLALNYLKTKEIDKAVTILQQIKSEPNNPYRNLAEKLSQ